jgi:hypothetical protein
MGFKFRLGLGGEFLHTNSIVKEAITSAEEYERVNLPKTIPPTEK